MRNDFLFVTFWSKIYLFGALWCSIGMATSYAQTILIDEDFSGVSGTITETVGGVYQINNDTPDGCDAGWVSQSTDASNCSCDCDPGCSGNRATIDYIGSSCVQDATAVIGTFTGVTNVDVSFDYAYDDYDGSDQFTVFIYNETTAAIQVTLLTLTTDVDDGVYGITNTAGLTATDVYSFRVRYEGTNCWGASFDNVLITSNCTPPDATYAVVPNCATDFSINVTVNSLGDATGVDITDGTTTYFTNVDGTANPYNIGTFTPGTNVTVMVNGTPYGGCDVSSPMPLTENCACLMLPVATVNTANLNCTTGTYDIEVTIDSDGSGDVNMSDILIDGVVVQADATTGMLYTFNRPTGTYAVTIEAEGATFVACEAAYTANETCNGGDVCTDAVDITNSCSTGDLTAATVDGANLVQNYINCGNGNTIAQCGANSTFTGSSYTRTDHTDIWYAVAPNGSDEMTVTISNLMGGNIMVLPYLTSGTCPTLASANDLLEDHIGNLSQSLTNGNCPYFSADGSLTFSGTALTTATTVYLRIMPYANNGSGATNCETLTYPTFDICSSVPQANDVCNDALNINSFDDDALTTDSYLPVTQSGDISAANIDAETSPAANGTSCGGTTMATSEEDLWYAIKTPPTGQYYVELDIDFTGTADEIYVILEEFCASGTVIGCESISADGTVVFDQNNITNFDNALTADNEFNIRIVLPTGSNASAFTIAAQLVAENNTCEVMQNVFPGFDAATNQDMNFNFSTDSGVDPVVAGNDLWYQFDPVSSTDANGFTTGSTTAEIIIGGLDAGEEVTLLLYKGNTVSANNCTDLAGDYLETLVVTSNSTVELSCLDELHTSVDGGYLVRVIQTAGGTTIDNGLIRVEPQPAGPYNNDCENIWNGTGPTNLGVGDASNFFTPYYLPPGFSNYLSGDFENATDCHPDIASAVCNGIDQAAIASNEDRDLWYVFQVPSNTCAADGLTVSSVVTSMTFLYNAGAFNQDGVLYVYSGCSDADLIDCSGPLDGAPSGAGDEQFNDPESTWTVNGLTQGEFYLLRVKPHDISSTGIGNEFDFDISMREGNPMPCNDDPANAEPLSVNTCLDYTSLETWSALGASETAPVSGAPESDVWFSFVAPSPANGGSYTTSASWVTVFFEAVSGELLTLEVYETMTSEAAGTSAETASGAGTQQWSQFGNLTPGQTYYLRLYHQEQPTTDVTYKIGISTGTGEEPGWACGENTYTNSSGCSGGCDDLREQWFKIDLPDNTPGNAYWMIEVFGYDEWLDFELRSKYLMGNAAYDACSGVEGATVGTCADYDHPCSSAALEPAVNISSTTTLNFASDLVGTAAPSSCDDNGTAGQAGQGVRRVYFNMNGAATGQKDYYFLRVFMNPSSPNYATATDIHICQLNFSGPYSTEALADAGGTPDGDCLTVLLSDNDNDGIDDAMDIDDDNDGIPDLVETGGFDPDGDEDGDGTPNWNDTVDNGTGDGSATSYVDSNGDGVPDVFDFDFDGVPNHFDLDADNDGIADIVEAGGTDANNDGMTDNITGTILDNDADGDGWDDAYDDSCTPCAVAGTNLPIPNTDGTGNPNYLDIDADDDGIVDVIEAQPTTGYIDLTADGNNNGWSAAFDGTEGGAVMPLTNTDGQADGADYIDTDSDDDGESDTIEAYDTNDDGVVDGSDTTLGTVIPGIYADADGDGLMDVFDNIDLTVNSGDNPDNNNQTATNPFPNDDVNNASATEPDWRDVIGSCGANIGTFPGN